ncbi:TadE/TadG family type IV pilus assembly protein [Pseudooctadecabacter jejudonensis]|uniref:TadE-like protein n=1 Tax=Pseudooctadecabacter jejudonensis TaxID=1391910 RepID=A0A1Y5SL43_9RHOB|nr:hypothetical protein [Pseudooctadecabacter jejudonensis]SLN40192.1 hypothetical protein PSJ8397_01993 [Pseudooctadecabacter jejudonensis]
MLWSYIKSHLRDFRKDDRGTITAEAVIMFPSLFACVIAMVVFFDAFRNQSINVKANYTIADAVSREDQYITNTYINNMWRVHRFLTSSPTLTRLRVSVIRYDAADDSHEVVWSRAKGGGSNYTRKPLSQIGLTAAEVPVMPDGEILIVVQTGVDYAPNFSIGLESFSFENVTFTRPRWSPRNLCFSSDGSPDNAICPAHTPNT